MRKQELPERNLEKTLASPNLAHVQAIARYRKWLAQDCNSHKSEDYLAKIKAYIHIASRPVMVRQKAIHVFAPFQERISALRTLTFGQFILLGMFTVTILVGLCFQPHLLLTTLTVLSSLIYICYFFTLAFFSTKTCFSSPEAQIDDALVNALSDAEWPAYTVLCPLYHEARVVPQFVQAMQQLDYPHPSLQILILLEEDDYETHACLQEIELPAYFQVLVVPAGYPRTKPRACNFGLLHASGDYIVIYDAEDIPDPLQLKKAVLAFANSDPLVACIQAKLTFYNAEQNLLTRWFTTEYAQLFDLTLPGLQSSKWSIPLGGTSNHFRKDVLCQLGAWDAFNVTEDCELGIRLSQRHLKTIVLASTTYEEANSQVKNWLRQRSRWMKGYMQTYLVYMRRPLQSWFPENLYDFLSLNFIIGGKVFAYLSSAFLLAILVVLLVAHVLLKTSPADFLLLFSLALGGLLLGNACAIYSHLISCFRHRCYHLILAVLFFPLYSALISIATLISLYQLIFKPHYWEKTHHGLHMQK